MIFRLSQKMAKKIKASWPLKEGENAPEPLADWSFHLFTARRSQYIILCNTPTLYTCLIHGRGITNLNALAKSALNAIRDSFENESLEDVYQERLVPNTGGIQLAKAYSRSVTGSIKEQIDRAKYILEDKDIASDQVTEKLNKNILSILDPHIYPRDAFRSLCGCEREERCLPSNVIPFPTRG